MSESEDSAPRTPTAPNPSLRYARSHRRVDPAELPRRVGKPAKRKVDEWMRPVPKSGPVPKSMQPAALEIPLVPGAPTADNRPRLVAGLDGHPDLRPDPFVATTPAEFVAAMGRFRVWAGELSVRELEKYSGGLVPRSTFDEALRADTLPKQTVLAAFISACGGDAEEVSRWVTAWRVLRLDTRDGGATD